MIISAPNRMIEMENLRPLKAELAIKDILESMGEVVDATKEGSFTKVTPRIVFALSPGYAHLPDGLKFVYAIVTLLSEKNMT